MSAIRKYFVNKNVHFVTTRTEEGLPIVPSYFLNFIIWGVMAKARAMFQVKVCHFCFLANHFHMILVVENPEHISAFMGYVKCEIAHAINRLTGRRRKTIWQDGYDSPVLLTIYDVVKYIAYIYLNPARAKLVKSITEYPGVSSWDMFISGIYTKTCKSIHRSDISALPLPSLSINEQKKLAAFYNKLDLEENTFVLEPYAWLNSFGLGSELIPNMHMAILANIQEQESSIAKELQESNKSVIGATELRRQSMTKEYQPKTFGKRMICLCSAIDFRVRFIKHYKHLCALAYEVYNAWKLGDTKKRMPPGMLHPRMPALISALPLSS